MHSKGSSRASIIAALLTFEGNPLCSCILNESLSSHSPGDAEELFLTADQSLSQGHAQKGGRISRPGITIPCETVVLILNLDYRHDLM